MITRRWGSCGHDSPLKDKTKPYFFMARCTEEDAEALRETRRLVQETLQDTPSNPILLKFLMDHYLNAQRTARNGLDDHGG